MASALIVDDEGDVRTLMRILIERSDQGVQITGEAANGDDALQVWRETSPDVIVLDQQMPGMTGLELAEIILGESPDQAIVLFTANVSEAVTSSAVASGVRAVIGKQHWSLLVDAVGACTLR